MDDFGLPSLVTGFIAIPGILLVAGVLMWWMDRKDRRRGRVE